MKDFLRQQLFDKYPGMIQEDEDGCYFWKYSEDINPHALTDDWLEERTSYILKVAVLVAMDSNKLDFCHIAIGVQRDNKNQPELKGTFYFDEGENDDMGRVIHRAVSLLENMHNVFQND